MPLTLPFAEGIATQEYLIAEEGALKAYEEGCSHWYVDLSLPSDHTHEWPPQRRAALLSLAERLQIRPILHGNFRAPVATELPEVRAGVRAYLREEIRLAHDLGAPLIIHGGSIVDPRPTESARWSALNRFLALLEEIATEAGEYGVPVWLENLSHYPRFKPFAYVFTRYADFVTARQQLPNLKYIFDLGHANVNQQFPLAILRDFGDLTAAISVSNNDGQADSHLGVDHGTVPISSVLDVIKANGWRGLVAFETRGEPVSHGVDLVRRHWDGL